MWGGHTPFLRESLACKTTSAFPAVSHGTICHFNMVNTWTRHVSTNTSDTVVESGDNVRILLGLADDNIVHDRTVMK